MNEAYVLTRFEDIPQAKPVCGGGDYWGVTCPHCGTRQTEPEKNHAKKCPGCGLLFRR